MSHLTFQGLYIPDDIRCCSSDKYEDQRRQWGGGIRGYKSTQMFRKRAKAAGQNPNAPALGKL